MNLGDLYVNLKASNSELTHSLHEASEHIEKFAKHAKKTFREVREVGEIFATMAAGAIAVAATVDPAIKRQVEDLKHAFEDLAVPVARVLMPAMKELAEMVRRLADFFVGLTPHTKELIGHFFHIAEVVAIAGFVLSKLFLAIQAVAGVIALVTSAPFIALLAVLVAVGTAAFLLHRAWAVNFGGIQDITRSVIEAISGYWSRFTGWLKGIWDSVIDGYGNMMRGVVKLTLALEVQLGKISEAQANQQYGFMSMGIDVAVAALKGGAISTAVLDLGKRMKVGFLDAANALKEKLDAMLENGGRAARHGGPVEGFSTSGLMAGGSLYGQAVGQFGQMSGQVLNRGGDASVVALAEQAAAQGKIKSLNDTNKFLNTGLRIASAERIRAEKDYQGSLSQMFSQLGAGLKTQIDHLLGKLGTFGQVMNAAMQGMASGGPWGALIGVVIELVSRMSSFTKMLDYFEGNIGTHIEKLSKAFAPLFEVFQMFSELVDSLTSTTDLLYPLRGIIWGLSKVFIGLAIATVEVAKFFSDLTGNHDQGLIDAKNRLAKEWAVGFDAVTTATAKTTSALAALNEQLINIPQGFKIAAARFGADNGGGGMAPGISGGKPGGLGSDPNTSYGSSGNNVSQILTGDSTKPAGAGGGGAASYNAQDQEAWAAFYKVAVEVLGMDPPAAARWAADQVAHTHGKSSSSSSATAAVNTGGGNSGIHQLAGTPGPADLPIYIDKLILNGVADVRQLYDRLVEYSQRGRALTGRNGF